MEETILHGGEKELQELKKILQEKNRYNAVLESLEKAVKEQKQVIENYKTEIEQEMNLEAMRRRAAVEAPFNAEIASTDTQLQKAMEERAEKRKELIEQLIQEEAKLYEKRKANLEKQKKLVNEEEGVPDICTTRLFLAFFCPRTGKDAGILIFGLLVLFLLLPMAVYFGIYGGNDRQALTTIYLVFIVVFYTIYLLINNQVKDKYLVGIHKFQNLLEDLKRLEVEKKRREKELENIPDSALDLGEYDEEAKRLQAVIDELSKEKELAVANFDSDERLHIEIGKEVQEKFRPELEQMRAVLDENIASYEKMQAEYRKFLEEKQLEQKYEILLRMEPNIFQESVIDELIFFIVHGDAETISRAIVKRKKKLGQPISL